jgi:hypothetical protein
MASPARDPDVGQTAIALFFSLSGATKKMTGIRWRPGKVSAGVRVDFGQIAGIDPYVSLVEKAPNKKVR